MCSLVWDMTTGSCGHVLHDKPASFDCGKRDCATSILHDISCSKIECIKPKTRETVRHGHSYPKPCADCERRPMLLAQLEAIRRRAYYIRQNGYDEGTTRARTSTARESSTTNIRL